MRKDLMPQLAFFASICRKSREERPADIQQPAAFMKKESASHFFPQYQNVLLERYAGKNVRPEVMNLNRNLKPCFSI